MYVNRESIEIGDFFFAGDSIKYSQKGFFILK